MAATVTVTVLGSIVYDNDSFTLFVYWGNNIIHLHCTLYHLPLYLIFYQSILTNSNF